ncbi:hypothetical protein D1007_42826 [Hordeum vulgare]|nr:hypothetical protein D1007_42826 [Hordeum vulgare]
MADDEEEQMPFFSQFPSHQQATQGSSAGGNLGREMCFLDLNSNVDGFPELGSYEKLLFDQSAGHGLPPVAPGHGRPVLQGGGGRSRSLNIGGRASSHLRPIVAPGAAAIEGGVIGSGRTVSQVTGRGVGRGNGSSSADSRGKTAGKQRVSSTAASSEDVDPNEGFEDEDDNNAFGEERPHVRKFKGGNPEYLDMLIELFQGVAVDGSSTDVPLDEDEEEECDVADDGNEQSPMSTTNRKRGSNGGEQSASSRGKKHKSPMVILMTGLINTMNSENTSDMITEYANKRQEAKDKAREKKSNNTKESITHCQLLVVQCGAEETSVEYFMSTQLFADEANRVIFKNISSNEARLTWLKRSLLGLILVPLRSHRPAPIAQDSRTLAPPAAGFPNRRRPPAPSPPAPSPPRHRPASRRPAAPPPARPVVVAAPPPAPPSRRPPAAPPRRRPAARPVPARPVAARPPGRPVAAPPPPRPPAQSSPPPPPARPVAARPPRPVATRPSAARPVAAQSPPAPSPPRRPPAPVAAPPRRRPASASSPPGRRLVSLGSSGPTAATWTYKSL